MFFCMLVHFSTKIIYPTNRVNIHIENKETSVGCVQWDIKPSITISSLKLMVCIDSNTSLSTSRINVHIRFIARYDGYGVLLLQCVNNHTGTILH